METVAIVLSVGDDRREEFEEGFRRYEVPVWEDLLSRGFLVKATLSRMEISSAGAMEGTTQYLIVAIFATGDGHHEHDHHPGFQAWNKRADAYQVGLPLAFGGATIARVPA